MIASYTRGRIRLRLDDLKGAEAPKLPKETLKGVTNLSINTQTGSALLEYDPEVLSVETIAAFVETFDPAAAESLRNPHLLKPRSLFAAPIPTLAECPPPAIPVRSPDAPPVHEPKPAKPRLRGSAEATAEVLNLGLAFLGAILSGFFSSRRMHVQLGALSGLMMVGHVWKHRKRLRPLHQMTLADLLGLPKAGPFARLASHAPEEGDSLEDEGWPQGNQAAVAQIQTGASNPASQPGDGQGAVGSGKAQGADGSPERPESKGLEPAYPH